MNTPVSGLQATLSTGTSAAEAALRSRMYQWVWHVESAGLLALTVMTFFPAWSHVQEYLFFSLFLTGCATAYGERRRLFVPSALHLPIALWLGWILLSVPFALDPAYSFAEWRKVVVKVLWFYWAMLVLRHSEFDDMEGKVLAAVAGGTLLLCAYALVDFGLRGGTWSDRLVRARAPSSDYNWLSSYLVMAVPLLAAGFVRMKRLPSKALFAGTTVLALLAQALSYTRAGWLAFLSQGYTFAIVTKRTALASGLLLGTIAMTGMILTVGLRTYHQDTRDPWTLQARVAVWSLMVEEIEDHPLFGVGYGTKTFMVRFGDRPETAKAKGSHSFFLMTAMGSGIPALAFLLWVLGAGFRECVQAARTVDRPASAALWLGVALMIVGVGVRNLFDAMFLGSLACLFWILLATALAQIPPREVPS